MANIFKCPFCDRKYVDKNALYDHMNSNHEVDLCGLSAAQVYFNYRNKYALTKGFGKSIVSGKPTAFNITTERYEKFANDKEKEIYREMFKRRMMNKYGKETLLTDPEHQKKMLAGRSISGRFKWDDGTETTYTGTYEQKFLEHLNVKYDWQNSADIVAPAPMIFPYIDSQGRNRFHIPDFYIQSLNLIVNIKSSTNMGYRLRDIEDEKLEDAAIKASPNYNYIKIYDNDFSKFDEMFQLLKTDDENKKRYFVI